MARVGVGPLPPRLLSFSAVDGEFVPTWLDDRDRPWLRDLLAEVDAAAGQPIAQLERRWRRAAPDPRAGGARAAVAQHVVLCLLRRSAARPKVAPMRQALFELSARGVPRGPALATVAARFGTTAEALLANLFADLPHEWRVAALPPEPTRVLLTANLALAQGLLRCARSATLQLHGNARLVLRTGWLHGTHFAVTQGGSDAATLVWRPSAQREARALASMLPVLPWTRRHRLEARCRIGNSEGLLLLATGDPILPGPEPRAYDSALERAFARTFAAAAPDWDLLREPMPLRLQAGFAFPDFALRHRPCGRRWLVEIAGLRDPAALADKLATLAAARHLLLCLPRRWLPGDLAAHPRVVAFDRRIDVGAVLRALDHDAMACGGRAAAGGC